MAGVGCGRLSVRAPESLWLNSDGSNIGSMKLRGKEVGLAGEATIDAAWTNRAV